MHKLHSMVMTQKSRGVHQGMATPSVFLFWLISADEIHITARSSIK